MMENIKKTKTFIKIFCSLCLLRLKYGCLVFTAKTVYYKDKYNSTYCIQSACSMELGHINGFCLLWVLDILTDPGD